MNLKTKIYFIRHGESLGNAARKILGHTDLDLSELGYRQAFATAEHLKDIHIDVIYSSDLMRAMHTAEPNARFRGLEVIPSKELREVFVGDWEGMSVQEIFDKYGESEYIDRWLGDYGNYVFPKGEAVWSAGERFCREVERISRLHLGQTVLIAAHAAVIRTFWAIISGIGREEIVEQLKFPTNASYSIAEYDGDKIIPVEFSCDEHLASVGITEYKG